MWPGTHLQMGALELAALQASPEACVYPAKPSTPITINTTDIRGSTLPES